MSLQIQNQAVCAKCRAMSAVFLKNDDYTALSKMATVKEIAAYLTSNTTYKNEFSGIDLQNINRLTLEQILHSHLYNIYMKLYRFSTGEIKQVIFAMIKKFDIDILISLFSKIIMGSDKKTLSNNQLEILEVAEIETSILLKAKSVTEASYALRGTCYYDSLLTSISDGELNLKLFETKLYEDYYNNLYTLFENSSIDSKNNIIGVIADFENLERIFRFKFNFNAPPEQIYPYIIRVYGVLSEKDLMRFCTLNYSELVSEIKNHPFGKRIKNFINLNNIESDEQRLIGINSFFSKFYRKLFSSTQASAQIPFAYLSLKELELENIVHIIEGVRYSLSVKEILKNVARY